MTIEKNYKQVIPLFAKVFYLNTIKINSKKIIKEINNDFVKAGFIEPTDPKEINSFTSSKSILNEKKFKELKEIIMEELYFYTKEILKYNQKFRMTTSWFTKTLKGEESNYHCHKNSYISCVLYINVNEKSGDISFMNYKDDKMFQLTPFEYNNFNSEAITIKPKNGMIIFFPSEIHHKVLRNETNFFRCSLACNFIPIGDIKDPSTDGYLHMSVK
jgi:uncharacterized protein (TIGR02466 family)